MGMERQAGASFTQFSTYVIFIAGTLHVWFHSRHWEYESRQSAQIPTLMELKSWWQRKIIDKLNKIGTMLDVNFKEQKTK